MNNDIKEINKRIDKEIRNKKIFEVLLSIILLPIIFILALIIKLGTSKPKR